MRMWMVDPGIMCRKHLLGEHVELHMFLSHIVNGKKVEGFVNNNLLEIASIVTRHEALVNEMMLRGYKHNSPLDVGKVRLLHISVPYLLFQCNTVDRNMALNDLIFRCTECKNRAKGEESNVCA